MTMATGLITTASEREIEKLRAELDAMRKQEPVLWVSTNRISGNTFTGAEKVTSAHDDTLYSHQPLYAAPMPTSAPEGWQIVPAEPTDQMILAARVHHEGDAYLPCSLYAAMLKAAPKPEDAA